MDHSRLRIASTFVLALAGCATPGPTPELQQARKAYDTAHASQSANLRPDELVDAKKALEAAEAAHDDDPGSTEERHLAYIAQRRAELAVLRGDRASIEGETEQKRAQLLSSAKSTALTASRALGGTKEELANERKKRMEAEALASKALADLKEVAMVKEESRGYVITLSGAVLFKTGDSELLGTAQDKLMQVAEALKQQDDTANIVVEGYTDSRGSDSYNQKLSLERAQSVRDYLVNQGVNASRITARGMGKASPIADNSTAEGRANNRRVEIVVNDSAAPSATQDASGAGAIPTM